MTDFVITLGFGKNGEEHMSVAFTIANAALDKDQTVAVILMLDGVRAAQPGYVDEIDIGEPFLPVKDLMEVFMERGGQVKACGSCLKLKKIAADSLLADVEVITGGDVADLLLQCRGSLQLT